MDWAQVINHTMSVKKSDLVSLKPRLFQFSFWKITRSSKGNNKVEAEGGGKGN
jgi:hypothetical protein